MNLTPSQLETLRKTGSVRVVVPMEPQPTEFYKGVPVFAQPMNEPHQIVSPLPSPGTTETIDGMECEWVERGCRKLIDAYSTRTDEVLKWYWTAIVRRKDDGDE